MTICSLPRAISCASTSPAYSVPPRSPTRMANLFPAAKDGGVPTLVLGEVPPSLHDMLAARLAHSLSIVTSIQMVVWERRCSLTPSRNNSTRTCGRRNSSKLLKVVKPSKISTRSGSKQAQTSYRLARGSDPPFRGRGKGVHRTDLPRILAATNLHCPSSSRLRVPTHPSSSSSLSPS